MTAKQRDKPDRQHALRQKTAEVERTLRKRLGTPEWSGPTDPLDMLVLTILSQNTNDVNRDRAWTQLRKTFPTWQDVLSAPPSRIARAIRVGGIANVKARNIKQFLKWVQGTYGRLALDGLCKMTPKAALELLISQRGIGLKTIYVTLLFACGIDVFPVDTHIYRIVRRLEIAPETASRDKVTAWMQPLVPAGKSYAFHINLITLGRTICKARNPLCDACPLRSMCPYPKKHPPR